MPPNTKFLSLLEYRFLPQDRQLRRRLRPKWLPRPDQAGHTHPEASFHCCSFKVTRALDLQKFTSFNMPVSKCVTTGHFSLFWFSMGEFFHHCTHWSAWRRALSLTDAVVEHHKLSFSSPPFLGCYLAEASQFHSRTVGIWSLMWPTHHSLLFTFVKLFCVFYAWIGRQTHSKIQQLFQCMYNKTLCSNTHTNSFFSTESL